MPDSLPLSPRHACRSARSGGWLAGLLALAGCAPIAVVEEAGTRRYDVTVVREALLPGRADEVFDYIAAEGVLPELLTGYGPLPAVTGTSEVSGPWSQAGSQRVVHTADGHRLREQVLLWQRPQRFAYRLWDFSHPLLRRLADGGGGDWSFTETAAGTQVRWAYTFRTGSRLRAWPLSLMAGWLWRGYMDTCLDNARRIRSGS